MGFATDAAMGSCGGTINALTMIDHGFGLIITSSFLVGGYDTFGQYYRFARLRRYMRARRQRPSPTCC